MRKKKPNISRIGLIAIGLIIVGLLFATKGPADDHRKAHLIEFSFYGDKKVSVTIIW